MVLNFLTALCHVCIIALCFMRGALFGVENFSRIVKAIKPVKEEPIDLEWDVQQAYIDVMAKCPQTLAI